MHANPYVITTNLNTANSDTQPFPWHKLARDTAREILGHCSSRIFASNEYSRRVPDALAPEQVLYARISQTLEIERSRAGIEGHGPKDTLTVTLSTYLLPNSSEFVDTTQQFQDEVRDAMHVPQRKWPNVSGIRLTRADSQSRWFVDLIRRVSHGEEIVRVEPWALSNMTGWTSRHSFVRMLTDELHLRHVAAAGADDRFVI